MRYFARVTAGLEAVAWREIEPYGAVLVGFGHRRIDFTYEGPPAALLALKSVDDVYLYVTRLEGFDRTRASLAHFQALEAEDFAPALDAIVVVREIGSPPTYAITASHLGKRNYSRYDVEHAVQEVLSGCLPWHYIPNRPGEELSPDIDLRILIEEKWALVGIRLGAIPLHRRPYKVASTPGSLKAPVAFALCMLADLKADDVLLDPTCGAGTILIEATTFLRGGTLIGIDRDEDAITATQDNGTQAGLTVQRASAEMAVAIEEASEHEATTLLLWNGDIRTVTLPEQSIGAIIANLPWGKQVDPDADLSYLYTALMTMAETVLTVNGRMVLLTDQVALIQNALQDCPRLTLTDTFQISLFGSHPTVHLIRKQ